MPSPKEPKAVASQPGGVASKPAVYVQAFDSGLRGFAYEFKAPCGCRHWSTGKFEYCPGHHAAVNSHAALVQALKLAWDAMQDYQSSGRINDKLHGEAFENATAALKLAGEEI
jgi:hypothetical protein